MNMGDEYIYLYINLNIVFADKCLSSQSYGISSNQSYMDVRVGL